MFDHGGITASVAGQRGRLARVLGQLDPVAVERIRGDGVGLSGLGLGGQADRRGRDRGSVCEDSFAGKQGAGKIGAADYRITPSRMSRAGIPAKPMTYHRTPLAIMPKVSLAEKVSISMRVVSIASR